MRGIGSIVQNLWWWSHLIVRESAVFINGINSGDASSYGLSLQHRFLLSFSEQRNVIIDILKHNVHCCFTGQLLHPIILQHNNHITLVEHSNSHTVISYLDTDSEVVLLNVFIVERVVDFDISPGMTIIRPRLKVKCVILICLRCGTPNQPVVNGGVVLNPRAGSN